MTKNNLPTLTFFKGFPEKHLSTPGVAAALQTIETTFRMSVLERWPTMILLTWQSCELLLRANLGIQLRERIDAVELQEQFKSQTGITEDLHSSAMDLRKLRNRVVHSGFSPQDDEESLKMYFGPGLAYINCLIKALTGHEMFQIGKTEGLHIWFWNLLYDVRKVVHKKNKQGKELRAAVLPLIIAAERINRFRGRVDDVLSTMDRYTFILQESFQDTEFRIRRTMGDWMSEELDALSSINESIFLPEFSCMGVCDSDDLNILAKANFENKENGDYKLTKVNAIGCIVCGHVISDPELLEVFVFDRLSEKQKELIGYSEYPAAHDNGYQNYIDDVSPRMTAIIKEIRDEKITERPINFI